MPRIQHAIAIDAPPDQVFRMVTEYPERMPDWWSAFELQQRITPPPTTVGSLLRYVYNMMGVKIKGEMSVVELTAPAHLHLRTTSGLEASFQFIIDPFTDDEGVLHTTFAVQLDYVLPGAILGTFLNRQTLEQHNLHDVQQALINLKALIETHVATLP
jgi:uncharacterized membrane protein